MRSLRTWLFVLLACGLLGVSAGQVAAQPAGLNLNRDCQTIRTCNFTRNGSPRGCLSSYSCRVCSFVRTSCRLDPGRRVCEQLRCTWG